MATKYRIPSFSNDTSKYWVTEDGGVWTCTCPHFVERLAGTGEQCKHIKSIREESKVSLSLTASMENLITYLQSVYFAWQRRKNFPNGSGVPGLSPLKVWHDIDPDYIEAVFKGIKKDAIDLGDLLEPTITEIGISRLKIITLRLKG